ncbi:hypothetical protein ABZ930_23485 [Streptomyces sp. NPDC046716]|uniref:hypothetical protein n=1 Tax=Streptomyces sp. NPDC046716 TaxID=3157093 RepID=UPI0033D793AD
MAKHIRPTTPPPAHIRVATANAPATPLTGGLLTASAGTAGAADGVTQHRKADLNGAGYGDAAFSTGNATASGQKNAADFVAPHESANGITSTQRTTISQNTTSAPGSSAAFSQDRWRAALTASDINGDGCPTLGARATN